MNGCTGTGCQQGRNPEGCECGFLKTCNSDQSDPWIRSEDTYSFLGEIGSLVADAIAAAALIGVVFFVVGLAVGYMK